MLRKKVRAAKSKIYDDLWIFLPEVTQCLLTNLIHLLLSHIMRQVSCCTASKYDRLDVSLCARLILSIDVVDHPFKSVKIKVALMATISARSVVSAGSVDVRMTASLIIAYLRAVRMVSIVD